VNVSKLISFVLIAVLAYGHGNEITNCLLQNGCDDINKQAALWSKDSHDHNHANPVGNDHQDDINCAIYHAYLSANGVEGSAQLVFPIVLEPSVGQIFYQESPSLDSTRIQSIRAPPRFS